MASDSPSATTPRMIGSRSSLCRAIAERIGRQTWVMSPSGLRTAAAQLEGPRIITPSITACPPMALNSTSALLAGALETPLEALDAAAGVEELLLARVERVAVGANLDVELGLRRAGRERVPARAGHGREDVLGMDTGLHCAAKIAEAIWGATLPPDTMHAMRARGAIWIFLARIAATAAAPAGSQASFARV